MKSCRWKLLLGAAAVVGAVGLAAPPAEALTNQIPVALLEMDGNTPDNPAGGAIDWDTPGIAGLPQVLDHFNMLDSPNPGGLQMDRGSKDDLDVSTWHFKNVDGTITPKDDIEEAWALAAESPIDGDTILYFAALRQSVNGGATSFGVWVFGAKVEIVTDPLDGDSFSDDEHKEGDGLFVVDVGGNEIEGIVVYQWQGGDGTDGSLVQIGMVGDADCSDSQSGNVYDLPICGEVSADGLFVEFAVDLDDVLGDVCVSSAMVTTRTSNTARASVKNFKLAPDFSLCGIAGSKVCEVTGLTGMSDPLFEAEFTVTLENDGAASIPGSADITITDDAGTPGDMSDDLTLTGFTVQDVIDAGFLNDVGGGTAGVWDAGEFLDIKLEDMGTMEFPDAGDTITGFFDTNDNPPTNSGTATVAFDGSTLNASFSRQCEPLDLNPAIDVTKACETRLMTTSGGELAVEVIFSGEVCNRGDVPLTVTATDNKVPSGDNPIVDGVTLAAAEICFDDADCTGTSDTCDGGVVGTCSTTTATSCVVDEDCPVSETCEGETLGACMDTIACTSYSGGYMPSMPNQSSIGFCSGSGEICSTFEDCPVTESCDPSDKYVPGTATFSNKVTVVGTNLALSKSCSVGGNPCSDDNDCTAGGGDECINGVMDMITDTCPLCP